ncbi:MAG TPA: hypothetical protein DDZ80_16365 [Cyanobacteria bacterium UBA8803]|nr:hypothetical protein [Cyanobacteria bacterium UBA9273]HBL59986.1 hypothetical protein [Cyanobacteria bacterium UBA8803]
MKTKLSLAAVLSVTAIASGVLLSSATSAQPCMMQDSYKYQETYDQPNWLQSPLAALITLPGIALATALSLRGRSYEG